MDVDFHSSNIKPHTNDDDNPTASPEPPRDDFQIVDTTHALLSAITPTIQLTGTTRVISDYFTLATMLLQRLYPHAPLPLRTFVGAKMAIHLSCDPSFSRMSVNETADKFKLPDLHGAFVNYINHGSVGGIYTIGGPQMAGSTMMLPTDTIEVWDKVRVQNHAYYVPHDILPAQTINASPPSDAWPHRCADVVLINTDPTFVWPWSGMKGTRTCPFL